MKKITSILVLILLSGCLGYSSKDNEMSGQVKKVNHNTPLICGNFDDADISLGVMHNGTGSMSTRDEWVYVPNPEDYKILQEAAKTGDIVKITYDQARTTFCVENITVTHVELVK